MNVRYIGRKKEDCFGNKLAKPFPPIAIVSFTEKEEDIAVAILESTGYEYDVFGEPGALHADVVVEGKEDYMRFMQE